MVDGATTLSVCFIGDDVANAETETVNAGDNGDLNVEDAVSAKIKGTDADNDLAVVAVKKSDIPEDTLNQIKIAQIGSSDDLAVGQQVVAIVRPAFQLLAVTIRDIWAIGNPDRTVLERVHRVFVCDDPIVIAAGLPDRIVHAADWR